MRLMSASIAATAVITATRAALKPRIAAERPATPSLALRAWSMNAVVSARGSRTPNTIAKFQGHSLADQLLARADQRAERVGAQ